MTAFVTTLLSAHLRSVIDIALVPVFYLLSIQQMSWFSFNKKYKHCIQIKVPAGFFLYNSFYRLKLPYRIEINMAFNEATIQNGNVLFSSELMKCKFQHIISFSKLSFIASLSVLTDLFVYFSLKALRLPISQTVWAWLALRSMFQFVESTVIRLDKIQFTSCHRAQDFIVLLRGRKKMD